MTLKKLIITCSIITLVSGAALPAHADDLLGALVGAAGGAAIGSNIGKGKGNVAAIAVGTLLGASIGSTIGDGNVYAADYNTVSTYTPISYQTVSYSDNYRNHGYRSRGHGNYRGYSSYTYSSYQPYYSSPTVYQSYYVNPAPQAQVVQVNSYQDAPEAEGYCREFNQSVTIAGKVQPGYGIACLQPDGSWKIKK